MRNILAPHKEQDGWVYVRVRREGRSNEGLIRHLLFGGLAPLIPWFSVPSATVVQGCGYPDDGPGSRIISSRRVEEAVETYDYLRRCAEDGLTALIHTAGWVVGKEGPVRSENSEYHARFSSWNRGETLREAYHRYKAKEA